MATVCIRIPYAYTVYTGSQNAYRTSLQVTSMIYPNASVLLSIQAFPFFLRLCTEFVVHSVWKRWWLPEEGYGLLLIPVYRSPGLVRHICIIFVWWRPTRKQMKRFTLTSRNFIFRNSEPKPYCIAAP